MDRLNKSDTARRPSGFDTAGRAPKRRPAPEPEKKEPLKESRPKKEPKVRTKREPREKKPRRILKAVLITAAVLLVIFAAILIVFGNSGKTIHQMPIIERETEQASFAPDATPIPGTEAL